MSRDLSKLSLYAIVNYTTSGDNVGAVTIPVDGIVTVNLSKYLMVWRTLIPYGTGAGTLAAAPALANNGITFQSSNAADQSTYQFVIYQLD
jgi:hypothetical protein